LSEQAAGASWPLVVLEQVSESTVGVPWEVLERVVGGNDL